MAKGKILKKDLKICKEPGCFEESSTKGFCRLHFIKSLAQKKRPARQSAKIVPFQTERRHANRLLGLDLPTESSENNLPSPSVRDFGENDLSLDDLELDLETLPQKLRKTG